MCVSDVTRVSLALRNLACIVPHTSASVSIRTSPYVFLRPPHVQLAIRLIRVHTRPCLRARPLLKSIYPFAANVVIGNVQNTLLSYYYFKNGDGAGVPILPLYASIKVRTLRCTLHMAHYVPYRSLGSCICRLAWAVYIIERVHALHTIHRLVIYPRLPCSSFFSDALACSRHHAGLIPVVGCMGVLRSQVGPYHLPERLPVRNNRARIGGHAWLLALLSSLVCTWMVVMCMCRRTYVHLIITWIRPRCLCVNAVGITLVRSTACRRSRLPQADRYVRVCGWFEAG
jgi:hypothetical protein